MAKAPAKTTRGVTGKPAAAKEKIARHRVPHKKVAKDAPGDAPPVTEDEEEWVEAYWAVQYRYDAAPLVRMLRDKPAPDWLPERIAWLLDPPKGYLGGRLLVSKPRKRNIETIQDDWERDRAIQTRLRALIKEKGKKEAFAQMEKETAQMEKETAQMEKETGLKQSSLYALLRFDTSRRLWDFYLAAGEVTQEEYDERIKELDARPRRRKKFGAAEDGDDE